ncbi:GNAT family N-acetyltransferase [Reinekea marinisedimentorum]|uniref:Putative acetyltransferase n=1 Tax=Reinekea marinisedimentorum TaxID=230495 RepID=A0A4R3IDI9_9GAMM|nr:GNAT family N-acetyltransferase [Reinekea marinisedimentorum]TCS43924.1 putative acetyltransferase [Reinekea marinisedimentorum]
MMIRQATTTDYPELADIYHDASLIAHPFIDPEFIRKDRRRVRDEYLPLNQSYLSERNGEVLGFVSTTNDHINGLFIKVDYQRQGIGSSLIDHLKERHQLLELCCFVDNYQAQRFYHYHGFEIVREQANKELPFDEYVMRWEQ